MKDNGSEIMEAASSDFFSCEKCDSTFVTSRSLDSHVKAFHPLPKVSLTPKRVFEPEMRHSNECEKVTIKTDEPGIEDISRKVKIHPCRLCNRDFTSKDKLTDHHNMVHSEVTITVTKPTRTSKMPKPRVSLLVSYLFSTMLLGFLIYKIFDLTLNKLEATSGFEQRRRGAAKKEESS